MWGRRAYLSLGGAVAAMLVAAGCGDEESAPVVSVTGASGVSGVSGSQALTKPAFIKQADAICEEANSAIADLGDATGDEATQISQELEITRSELESLQALTPPDQDRATLSDFLTALKNEVDALTRAASAAAGGGDTSAADAEVATAKSNAQEAATEYGFEECGNARSQPTVQETPTTPTATTPTTPVTPTTTTPTVTTVPTTPTTPAPAPPPSGGTGGAPPSGGTGGSAGGTGGGTGSGGTGGVSP
jgi:hypothetical protein